MTSRTLLRAIIGVSCAAALTACKDSGPSTVGPPSQIALLNTGGLSALANTVVPAVQVSVQDERGTPIPNQTVTFTVTAGGGSVASATATSDETGTVNVPDWTLGKSASQQTLRAAIGSVTLNIQAEVATNFDIKLRFWGSTPVSATHQALFINAAARLRGMITGDIVNVNASGFDPSQCGVVGEPVLSETIDDVLIYASVQFIDGPGGSGGNVLAQTFICAFRNDALQLPAIGVMTFDSADIDNISNLQEVITHEMLHVIGIGIIWVDPPARDLLEGSGTQDPRYTGSEGRQGCIDVGGTTTCATNVPVEGSDAGPGTADSHWRENSFGNEMMTGFLNPGSQPISLLTIKSLTDLGYSVNTAAKDDYTIPGAAIKANAVAADPQTGRPGWESILKPVGMFDASGRFHRLRTP